MLDVLLCPAVPHDLTKGWSEVVEPGSIWQLIMDDVRWNQVEIILQCSKDRFSDRSIRPHCRLWVLISNNAQAQR